MKPTSKVVIVDDHDLFVKGLEGLVNKVPNFEVIFTACDGVDLIEKIPDHTLPDLILLDISMPNMDGFATAEWLTQHHPTIPFLALSMHDDEKNIIGMLMRGAKGYLLKGCKPSELALAIQQVQAVGFYYSQLTTNALLKKEESTPTAVSDSGEREYLTERELNFIKLCGTDQTYGEIAEAMFVSARTIENYRESVSKKFNVKTRVGIVLEGIRKGIIQL